MAEFVAIVSNAWIDNEDSNPWKIEGDLPPLSAKGGQGSTCHPFSLEDIETSLGSGEGSRFSQTSINPDAGLDEQLTEAVRDMLESHRASLRDMEARWAAVEARLRLRGGPSAAEVSGSGFCQRLEVGVDQQRAAGARPRPPPLVNSTSQEQVIVRVSSNGVEMEKAEVKETAKEKNQDQTSESLSASPCSPTGRKKQSLPPSTPCSMKAFIKGVEEAKEEEDEEQESAERPLGRVRQWMDGPFEIIMAQFIVLNCTVMFIQQHFRGCDANALLGLGSNCVWPYAETFFADIEHFFNCVFIVELVIRLIVLRRDFFRSKANLLDSAIVLITAIDAYIISQTSLSSDGSNISFLRMIRLAKLARVLRTVHTLSVFQQLRVLIRTIASSFGSLFWGMLVLFFFQVMSSLFLCQMLHSFIIDEQADKVTRLWVNQMYGSSGKALWTMFEMTFSGGWPKYARPLVEEVSPFYCIFFVCYIGGVHFAIIRIVSALFLKETLRIAADDAELQVQQRMKEKEAFARKLRDLFDRTDQSGDGLITQHELDAALADPKVLAWLSVLDIQVQDMQTLFTLLDDGDGCITNEEFVQGVLRIKGTARSQDTMIILHDCKRILKEHEALRLTFERLKSELVQLQQAQPEPSPARCRASPSCCRGSPARYRGSPTRYRGSPTRFWG